MIDQDMQRDCLIVTGGAISLYLCLHVDETIALKKSAGYETNI